MEEEKEDDENFVMLVIVKKEGGRTIKKWKEFELPLEEHRVENWCGLFNLKFHAVTTWIDCKQRGINFWSYKYHKIDDGGMSYYTVCYLS